MTRKRCRNLRVFLTVVACIAFVFGIFRSIKAGDARAHDVNKIKLDIEQKTVYYTEEESPYMNGCYHIDLDVTIQNGTASTLGWLDVQITVLDQSGKELGVINTEFGGYYASSSMKLEAGESASMTVRIQENKPENNAFFVELYEAKLSDLRFAYTVTDSHFDD